MSAHVRFCGGRNGSGTDFLPRTSVFPVSITTPMLQTGLYLPVAYQKDSGRNQVTFQKAIFFRKALSLSLHWEIIAVCSEVRTKYRNSLCGQHVDLLNVN